jgi:hypothetical protein
MPAWSADTRSSRCQPHSTERLARRWLPQQAKLVSECERSCLPAAHSPRWAYIGWHELVALRWEGYSRISNAISELHLTGTPTKLLLDPWQGWVNSALLASFGVGIWLSARGSRSLRVSGALMILPATMTPLWMIFGKASLAAHIALAVVGILSWLVAIGVRCCSLGEAVTDLLAREPRGSRGVQRIGPFVRTGGQRGPTNTLHWARRADRVRHLLLMAVGACGGPLA